MIEGTELLARCVQHETDHLDGVLFIDRMDKKQRKLAMKAIREAEWYGDPIPEIPRDVILEAARLYIDVFETITGQNFIVPEPDIPILARIRANLAPYF